MNFLSGRPGFYEEITASRGNYHHHPESYRGGGGAAASPTNNNGGAEDPTDDSDDHILFRRSGGGEGNSSTTAAAAAVIQREHMFDKVVTPSDVGKLNRLVIPKQHAEKYFPLDSSANEKGLLLNFEDRNGKPWRFRYSYWNSSQSYVMTKGWSRFVKEKKLDAGDIVSFQRGVGDLGKDRLFIDWRRRPDAPELPPPANQFSFHRWSNVSPLFMQPPPRDYSHLIQLPHHQSYHPYHHHQHHHNYGTHPYAYNNIVNGSPCPPGSIVYLRSAMGGGGGGLSGRQSDVGETAVDRMVFDSVPVVQGKAAAKRLRLFGVNMDCPISESDNECDVVLSSATTAMPHHALPPPLHHQYLPPPAATFEESPSSSVPSSLQYLRPNSYRFHNDEDKGKGSMSLDLDI